MSADAARFRGDLGALIVLPEFMDERDCRPVTSRAIGRLGLSGLSSSLARSAGTCGGDFGLFCSLSTERGGVGSEEG